MVRRTSLNDADCPVARALDAIGDWWSLLIVRDAFDCVTRFNEFQKGLGVSKGILATRLQNLTALGILETAPAADGSAYQEYILTSKGRDLFPVVVGLRQWGEDYCFAADEPPIPRSWNPRLASASVALSSNQRPDESSQRRIQR